MTRRWMWSAIAISLLLPTALIVHAKSADDQDKPAVSTYAVTLPRPNRDLDQLKYFQGTWRCVGQPSASGNRAVELSWTVEPDLEAFWYIARVKQQQPRAKALALETREFLGYNMADNRFVRIIASSQGELLDLSSPGWRADELVWEGTVSTKGRKLSIRETIKRISDQAFAATWWQQNIKSKQWDVIGQEACQKVS